jgi:hypothetical protein
MKTPQTLIIPLELALSSSNTANPSMQKRVLLIKLHFVRKWAIPAVIVEIVPFSAAKHMLVV